MNPLGIFAIIIALAVGYYGFNSDFGQFNLPGFGSGSGPIATGSGSGAGIEDPQPVSRGFLGFGGAAAPESQPAPRPGESPYKGKVTIARVNRSGLSPADEYVVIRYGGGFFGLFSRQSASELPVDVTGWSIGSRRTNAVIPGAYNIPEIDAVQQDIILSSGGEVIILVGASSYQRNFRENACVGYLNEFHDFTPSLSNRCMDSRPDRGSLLSRGFNGACVDAIEGVSTCRVPGGNYEAGVIGAECIDYLRQNFNYAGCVRNFRDRSDFFGNVWRVSLRQPSKLFDPQHDRVILRDKDGLVVDEFEY